MAAIFWLESVNPWSNRYVGSPRGRYYTRASAYPHAPPLQAFLAAFSQHPAIGTMDGVGHCFKASAPRAPGCRIDRRMRSQATTHYQTYLEGVRRADLHPEKSVQFGPDGARSRKNVNYPRAPRNCNTGMVSWTPYYPTDSQLQVYDIYIVREGYFGLPARDVNILIWTSRKSIDHGTNDRVMVHGDGTRADGRRSWVIPPKLTR